MPSGRNEVADGSDNRLGIASVTVVGESAISDPDPSGMTRVLRRFSGEDVIPRARRIRAILKRPTFSLEIGCIIRAVTMLRLVSVLNRS